MGIIMNEFEELEILRKLELQKGFKSDKLHDELINIRNYPYMNFKNLSRPGLKVYVNKTIQAIRYCNIINEDLIDK
jgi:hypothetical protein